MRLTLKVPVPALPAIPFELLRSGSPEVENTIPRCVTAAPPSAVTLPVITASNAEAL